MPLKMRKTGLGSPVRKDQPDYVVLSGGWGDRSHLQSDRRSARIQQVVLGSHNERPLLEPARAVCPAKAKEQLQAVWDRWKAWAELEEVPSG